MRGVRSSFDILLCLMWPTEMALARCCVVDAMGGLISGERNADLFGFGEWTGGGERRSGNGPGAAELERDLERE